MQMMRKTQTGHWGGGGGGWDDDEDDGDSDVIGGYDDANSDEDGATFTAAVHTYISHYPCLHKA